MRPQASPSFAIMLELLELTVIGVHLARVVALLVVLSSVASPLLVQHPHQPLIPPELLSASSSFASKHAGCTVAVRPGSQPPLVRLLIRYPQSSPLNSSFTFRT
ncbi:hypothetical protein Syun_021330 [Stephania yunnanensis]|uniref:Uncharacterized protein n=1 Tax=Stephania yunnanensis TaxID=152371 RepID=A0AAP0NPN4_9MAGN